MGVGREKLRSLVWLAIGAATVLTAGVSVAQSSGYGECSRKPSPQDIEGARGAHEAASQFYDRGDYEKAIRYWRDAYDFDCTAHGVLLNIANAYEKKGDKQGAITALETYLARAKTASNVATIQARVTNLKGSLTPANSGTGYAPPPPPTSTAQPTSTASAAPTASSSAAPPPPSGPRPYGNIPLYVAGGGGVVGVVGIVLTLVGSGKYSSAKDACPTFVNCGNDIASKGNSGRTLTGVGLTMDVLGGLAVGGGLVWHFAFNAPKDSAPTAVVVPLVGPGTQGVSVIGRF
jgi:hypothetical protein